MNPYKSHGYANRLEYLESLADELEIDRSTVFAAADILGPSEDFDGLVASLQDYADGY
jgi:hypothetical protein